MEIVRATVNNIDEITPLFDAYRQFYEQPGDPKSSAYLRARLDNNESTIFLAYADDQKPAGFTQLYPSFCSVEMIKIFVLYDLYVVSENRNQGIAQALLEKAKCEARACDVERIDLQTAHTNTNAQRLYKTFGYEMSEEFQNWSFYLADNA